MKPLKKPQKPSFHSNSKIARQDLEKWLPSEWNFAKHVDDDDSGYEWGEDWIVEIVENEQALGAKFSIQSKVLTGKDAINSNGIGTELNISTINRLFDIVYPVLIHYVHPATKSSYVIWLSEWLAQQPDTSWREKGDGEVTIRIPTKSSNELNQVKIEEIKQYTLFHSLRHGNYKLVDLINKNSTDHRIELIQTEKDTTFVVHSLHDKAVPHLFLLDDEAIQSSQILEETGLPAKISGKIGLSNFPNLLLQQMQNLSLDSLVISPQMLDSRKLIFSLEILNHNRELLYKIEQIVMKKIQSGTKITKWKGSSELDGIEMIFTHLSDRPKESNLNFETIKDNNSPTVALNRLNFILAMQQGAFSRLTELSYGISLGESSIESLEMSLLEKIPTHELELAEALVMISSHLKVTINFPEKYSLSDVDKAKLLCQILNNGRIDSLMDYPERADHAYVLVKQEILPNVMVTIKKNIEENSDANLIIMPSQEVVIKLLEHTIPLGLRVTVLYLVEIYEPNPQDIFLDSGVQIAKLNFRFDPQRSYTIYKNWCSQEDKEKYF